MQLHCLVRSELCCRGICTAGAVQFYLYISWVLYRCTYTSLVCTIVHVHPVRCTLDYIAHYCMVILYVFALYTWLVQNIVQSHLHIVQCHWHFYCLSDSSSAAWNGNLVGMFVEGAELLFISLIRGAWIETVIVGLTLDPLVPLVPPVHA